MSTTAWALTSNRLPSCSSGFVGLLPAKAEVSPDIESSSWVLYTDDGTIGKPIAQASHRASVFNCFCELSELVHETLYLLLTPSRPPQTRALLALYTKFLSWYDLLPDIFRLGQNSTPAVLFAHMYYHFAIILLFRPFTSLSIPHSKISPRHVCLEAADAVSGLVQSFAELYTLQRLPSLVPNFLLASSVMLLSLHPGPSLAASPREPVLSHIASTILRNIAYLDEVARCHGSAARAGYLVRALARTQGLFDGTQDLASETGVLSRQLSSRGGAFEALDASRLSRWVKHAGRFLGVARGAGAGAGSQELENPPFWLVLAQEVSSSRAALEGAGWRVSAE